MQPEPVTDATLGDLIERILDKGLMVQADLIISVADIPLVGVNLGLGVASIETMQEYGLLGDWDFEAGEQAALLEAQTPPLSFEPGEHVVAEQYASYRCDEGISRVWRPARLYLTDRRLLLMRKLPREVLFDVPLTAVVAVGVVGEERLGVTRDTVCLELADGEMAALYAEQPALLDATLRDRLARLGREVGDLDPADIRRLDPRVVAESKLWLQRRPSPEDALVWQMGWATLTETAFFWWGELEQCPLLELTLSEIEYAAVERRDLGALLGEREVLRVGHGTNGSAAEEVFAGSAAFAWRDLLYKAGVPPKRKRLSEE